MCKLNRWTCECFESDVFNLSFRMGYKIISGFFYMGAILCVLYCQDSVFRLSYVIAGTFILITLHQLLAPKEKELSKEEAPADFLDDLKTNYDRIKTVKGFVKK